MGYKVVTTITESQHGYTGIGDIVYKYDIKVKDISVQVGNGDIKLFTGDYAKRIAYKINRESVEDVINKAKQLSSDACGIQFFRLHENSRNLEIVFARYLIFWYANSFLGFSLKQSGNIFFKDHATALHGIRVIKTDDKYLRIEQRQWKSRFFIKLRNEKLITPDEYNRIIE